RTTRGAQMGSTLLKSSLKWALPSTVAAGIAIPVAALQMVRGAKLRPSIFIAITAICFATSSQRAVADVIAALGLEASVGVDEATRSWLSTLPEQWRSQINKIVEETLTSVDLHLDKALAEIRKQLAAAEDEATCKWLGANLQTIDVWKSQLPFLKQP